MKLNKTKLQLCTAGATDDFDSAGTITKIREAGTAMQTCIASLEDALDEPLKSKFSEIKGKINTMLAGLPETDKVPAAMASNDVLQRLLGVLQTAQMMISSLDETAKSSSKALQSTRASIPTEIANAIDAKVKSGDLVTKDEVAKKIKDATDTAITAARQSAVTELKRVTDRKLELTTASIPVPGDEVLGAEDKDYAAKKTAAEKRTKELAPFKLAADRVLALAWNTDESAYTNYFNDLKAVYANASTHKGANPFAADRSGDGKSPAISKTMLC